ncbi:hypothetical protein BJX64DRAFT_293545 [Aspergillus heterothallicus]
MLGEDSTQHERGGRAYPRKRASIACATCRARKTRCDGAKPRCSFCEDLDINCQYQRPADRPRNPESSVEDILLRLENQLHRIEACIPNHGLSPQSERHSNSNSSSNVATTIGPTTPSFSNSHGYAPTLSQEQEIHPTPDHGFNAIHDPGSVDSSSRIFRTEWPDLESFESLPPLNPIHYDDTEDHTYHGIQRGEQFAAYTPNRASIDLSARTINRYQQAFVRNVLAWIPVFDQGYMVSVIRHASEQGFNESDLSSALGLLILALGAISSDDENVHDDPARFAGVDYFVLGFRATCYLTAHTVDILFVQCHVLSSLYFLYTTRQFQACQSIARASSAMPVLFKLKRRIAADAQFHQLAVRAFWACYVLEYELTGKLSPHLHSLSDLLDTMHLPHSEYEDLGGYFFSSAIALRKLIERVMDLVRYSGSGTGTLFAPIIAHELHKQLSSWYSALPPMLRFPLDTLSPVLDGHGHKAFLRAQYFSILAVTNWTFVLRLLDCSEPIGTKTTTMMVSAGTSAFEMEMGSACAGEGLQGALAEQARQCVQSAVAYIYTLESLMSGRHLMLVVHLKGLFTISVMLCSVFKVARLNMVVGDWGEAERAVARAVGMMEVWAENGSVAAAVQRLKGIVSEAGIGVE